MTVPFFFLPSEKQKSRISQSTCSEISGSRLFDNLLKTPIKKRCPFRESSENSKKAPQIKLYIHLQLCTIGVHPLIMADASMEHKKTVLTFLLKIVYFLRQENRISKKKTLQMATFLKLHLKCSLKMEVPARFELANNGFADRGLTTWLRYHMK